MGIGIINGAMAGLGQGLDQVGAQSQQQQGQLYNAENLAQMNANLDVQKQQSLMQMKYGMADDLDAKAAAIVKARNAQSSPPQIAQQTNAQSTPVDPVIANAIAKLDPTGETSSGPGGVTFGTPINPNQGWDGINAQVKAQQPQANSDGLKIVQNELANTTDPDQRNLLQNEIANRGGTVAPQTSSQQEAVSASQSAQFPPNLKINPSGRPIIWSAPPELELNARAAGLRSPDGSGYKTYMEANGPTSFQRSLYAQGIDPGSVEGQAAQNAQRLKETYIAPTNIRSNYQTPDGQIHMLPGVPPAGYVNQQNADGSFSLVQMKNGTEAVSAEQNAKDQGKAQSAAWETQKAAAAQVPGIIARIKTLEPLLNQFTSGTGAQQLATWKSWANTHGVPIDTNATDAAQEFNKYASQMLSEQRAGMGGSATDAAQDMAEAGSANIGLGNNVNRNVLAFMQANAQGTLAFQTAKQAMINKNGGTITPNQASNFDSQWNNNYDPRIILYSHMQPSQRDAFVGSLKPDDAQEFERKFTGYTNLINQYK